MAPITKTERVFAPHASVVLVGCPGAGKRTLGFIGAVHQRRRLITENQYFERTTGMSKNDYLTAYGGDGLASRSVEVFTSMLDNNQNGCIIACGVTSFVEEAQDALRKYAQTNPVIHVRREKEHIARLNNEAEALLEADETHSTCSNLEYYNLFDDSTRPSFDHTSLSITPQSSTHEPIPSALLAMREGFQKYLDFVSGHAKLHEARRWRESPFSIAAIRPEHRSVSFALRLRLSYIMVMPLSWEDFEASADCVELIIDRWPDDLRQIISQAIANIRRKLGIPVIFHVEENSRGHKRPLEGRDEADARIYELGLRLGVDNISLDLERKEPFLRAVLQGKGHANVIGNFWYSGLKSLSWHDNQQVENFKRAHALGCVVVRMIRFCPGDCSAEAAESFLARAHAAIPEPRPPVVTIDWSVLGTRFPQQSRVLWPVKHPKTESEHDHLATVSSSQSCTSLLFQRSALDPLKFFVFGANVGYSLSPVMHTAAYESHGLPHTFRAVACSTVPELEHIYVADSFGGASLTAPFKVAMLDRVAATSQHARAIGAINVLLPLRGSAGADLLQHANMRNRAGRAVGFYGDNTDWSSILTCLRRSLSPRNNVQPSRTTALVIGAGGMARAAIYALLQLGCRNIFIYNRTARRAQDVAIHFNQVAAEKDSTANGNGVAPPPEQVCRVIPALSEPWPAGCQQPTIVISCVPATSVDGTPPAEFQMPEQWLQSPTGGVVMELAYEPLITPLVAQMLAFRETVAPWWVVVDGLAVVSEMAIEAFELHTGRPAPKRLMRDVCRRAWVQHQREVSSGDMAMRI